MDFVWKLPGEEPDASALERMRHHFPKPNEPMPIAWFMGEILFYDSLVKESPQTLNARKICDALDDIAGGIFSFPQVKYVPIWKAWFKYLLPELIVRADDPANFNDYWLAILVKTIVAFFNVYPTQIFEEFPGFSVDVVRTLGMRAIPRRLARETLAPDGENNLLFVDIWDASHTIKYQGFQSFDEVNSSILFCLKYLAVNEIADWIASLFQINSVQWRLQLIFSLTEWRTFTNLTHNWNSNERHFLRNALEHSALLHEFCIPDFKSLDEFLPPENVKAFEQSISEQFSFDRFRAWTDEIWTHLNTATYNIENDRYLNHHLGEMLRDCESAFFADAKNMAGRGTSIKMPYEQ